MRKLKEVYPMEQARFWSGAVLVLFCLCGAPSLRAQDLNTYLLQAEANNPEVQAFETKYHLAKERVEEANALPNTELGVGVFVSEPETRTGAQKARFSIKQMLPWFGTITARERYGTAVADVDYLEIAIVKRKLRLAVSQAYYALYALKKKQGVLQENLQLLQTYENLALASVSVGRATAVDVLRLQIRQNELLAQMAILQRERASQEQNFNFLLNRDAEQPVAVVDSLPIFDMDLGGMAIPELHPELEKYDRLYASVTQSELLNQKESRPNVGLGLDYIPVADREGLVFDDNGKDIIMPMVSLSIPIFNSRHKSRSVQNKLRQEVIDREREQRKNTLNSLLATAVGKMEVAKINHATQLKNLEQAKTAETILVKNYETGTLDFSEVLQLQELQLKLEIQRIEAVKNYYGQAAVLNYLTHGT
ncbi:TolC family protein [Maribacter sp. 2307ULW6-5]|uniref:TolC family protein n=1 Tax=Maribacter sp. 2307ULW6-5 TaxID=3386275 RepID=UPI0039BCFB56